ncbi:ankyrin repeat, SAM and basic leucine zipper domain-containing protein 1 [Amia ocellicauda]|uniref:ankyrin repeat, SAM and basic leucine zipper domain-containing protein 1 n=1 Tax=Amia ocellicauda TaxID=2972642 RepID=UPI0034638532
MLYDGGNAFPAGDESDGSEDEWDLEYGSSRKHERLPVSIPAEDQISSYKRAIQSGDVQLVEQLLDSGMDVDSRLGFEWTPLMCAAHVANYELAQILLDRGANANFSKDHFTVLMAACTASAPEDKIVKCVELLLCRNANANLHNKSRMSPLMFAARDGYAKVITLLISHGAEVNAQDVNGYTALMFAVQYARETAVLKLLELGANRTLRTKDGKSAAEIAQAHKRFQIARILAASQNHLGDELVSKEETLYRFFKRNPDPIPTSNESASKLVDIEVLLHGLNLEHLTDIMLENDITWGYLLTMEKEDLEKIGITDLEDQKKIMSAIQEIQLDKADLRKFTELGNFDCSSTELYNYLISLRQQCCYLTETVQDVINKLPKRSCELVLAWDPQMESQSLCEELVLQTGDLHKEVTCLRNLLDKMNHTEDPCRLPSAAVGRKFLKGLAVALCGIGLLFLYAEPKRFVQSNNAEEGKITFSAY